MTPDPFSANRNEPIPAPGAVVGVFESHVAFRFAPDHGTPRSRAAPQLKPLQAR